VDIDRIEVREGEFEVYNFEVEEFHTYFVSDLGLLVHNSCDDFLHPNPKSLLTKPSKIAAKYGVSIDEVNDAIHIAKEDPIVRANFKGSNPDIGIDSDGEIFIRISKGKYSGDSIGNITDLLDI
ncbi:MAG: hypothetical protein SAL07_25365, partial [Oscillatoria sp. PMC 1051.18]|nr:hypothetical protein [Oscillatoria sp. PMC 1051.18]